MAPRVPPLALSLLCLAHGPSAADTLRVPEDYATPQAAVNAAQDGDTIEIGAGQYPGFAISDRNLLAVRGQAGHRIQGDVRVFDSSGIELRSLRVEGGIDLFDVIASAVSRCRVFGGTIYASGGADVAIQRNRIENGDTGVFVDEVDGATLRRNLIVDAAISGIVFAGGNGRIKGNKVEGLASAGAIDASGAGPLRITKNQIVEVSSEGIVLTGQQFRVDGNEVLTAGVDGIVCTGGGNHRIEENLIKRTRDGIDIKASCPGNELTGNRIKKMRADGIDLDSSGNVVTGNRIKGALDVGIQLIAGGNTVSGNVIKNTGGPEIRDDAGGNSLGGNACPDNPGCL